MNDKWWKGWSADDATPDIYVLTKLPPQENLSSEELSMLPAHIRPKTEEELNSPFWYELLSRGVAFKHNPNPLYAIEAFLLAHEVGVYPPLWVINYMAETFDDWRKSSGEESLDKLFNLKAERGQTPTYKADLEERRDERLCQDVYVLKTFFKFSIDEACHMVERRLEEIPDWNKTALNLTAIKTETIKERYYKKWGEICAGLNDEFALALKRDGRLDFLKQFPEDSFPATEGKTFKDMILKEE